MLSPFVLCVIHITNRRKRDRRRARLNLPLAIGGVTDRRLVSARAMLVFHVCGRAEELELKAPLVNRLEVEAWYGDHPELEPLHLEAETFGALLDAWTAVLDGDATKAMTQLHSFNAGRKASA